MAAVARPAAPGRRAACVTLTGPGGVGKTRLALQVAAELADDFADGVCFVALAPIRDPDLVAADRSPRRSASRGRRRSAAPDDPRRRSCANAGSLLVLDNFEQVLAAAPVVAELLARLPAPQGPGDQPGGAARLAASTSSRCRRWRCPTATRRHARRPGAGATAVALFVERARGRRARLRADRRERPGRGRDLRRLDGLPLAIELAAARVDVLPPQRAAGAPGAPAAAADRRGARPARRGSRRCATRSPGATTCSTRPSRRSSAGWPSSSAAARWRRPRRVGRCDGDSRRRSSSTASPSLVDKSLLRQDDGAGRRAALRDAGDDPRVRAGAAGGERRGG